MPPQNGTFDASNASKTDAISSHSVSPIEIDEIDAPVSSVSSSGNGTALSNAVLQSGAREREVERQAHLQNGNTPPQLGSKRATGKPINELCARLAIECEEVNSKGRLIKAYYCIGCDDRRSNNTEARALPHLIECAVSS
jgi:hypothetical protein